MGAALPYVLTSAASTALSMSKAANQAKAANAAVQAQADAQARQIRESQAIEERRRKEQMIRNLAAQRARAGAGGVGGAGGSLEALLRGLSSATERDLADARRMNLLQINDIYGNLAHTQRRNLLDARYDQLGSVLKFADRGVDLYGKYKSKD